MRKVNTGPAILAASPMTCPEPGGNGASKHSSKQAGLHKTPSAVLQTRISMRKREECLQYGAAAMCRKSEGDFESREVMRADRGR